MASAHVAVQDLQPACAQRDRTQTPVSASLVLSCARQGWGLNSYVRTRQSPCASPRRSDSGVGRSLPGSFTVQSGKVHPLEGGATPKGTSRSTMVRLRVSVCVWEARRVAVQCQYPQGRYHSNPAGTPASAGAKPADTPPVRGARRARPQGRAFLCPGSFRRRTSEPLAAGASALLGGRGRRTERQAVGQQPRFGRDTGRPRYPRPMLMTPAASSAWTPAVTRRPHQGRVGPTTALLNLIC